jgi:hypothetical protein
VTRRKPLTRSQLATLILEQEGKCKSCGNRLDFAKKGQVVDEHLCPVFSTPEGVDPNRTENRALFCKTCADEKTSKEAPDRAKVRRIEGGKTQADRRAQRGPSMKSRGFQQRPPGTPSALSKDSAVYQRAKKWRERT